MRALRHVHVVVQVKSVHQDVSLTSLQVMLLTVGLYQPTCRSDHPKFIYFHYLKKIILSQSIQKKRRVILKAEALFVSVPITRTDSFYQGSPDRTRR